MPPPCRAADDYPSGLRPDRRGVGFGPGGVSRNEQPQLAAILAELRRLPAMCVGRTQLCRVSLLCLAFLLCWSCADRALPSHTVFGKTACIKAPRRAGPRQFHVAGIRSAPEKPRSKHSRADRDESVSKCGIAARSLPHPRCCAAASLPRFF